MLNYGPNTVQHMMSGKAFDRAVRGHLLLEHALTHLLPEFIVPSNSNVTTPLTGQLSLSDIEDLRSMCAAVVQDGVDLQTSDLLTSDTLAKVVDAVKNIWFVDTVSVFHPITEELHYR